MIWILVAGLFAFVAWNSKRMGIVQERRRVVALVAPMFANSSIEQMWYRVIYEIKSGEPYPEPKVKICKRCGHSANQHSVCSPMGCTVHLCGCHVTSVP